jgi:ABC-2 type transport system permease protein
LSFAVYAQATGAKYEVEHVAVAVVDEDHSELSRRIASAILEPYFKQAVEIPATEIDPGMNSGRFVFVLEVPPKFEEDVLAVAAPRFRSMSMRPLWRRPASGTHTC